MTTTVGDCRNFIEHWDNDSVLIRLGPGYELDIPLNEGELDSWKLGL